MMVAEQPGAHSAKPRQAVVVVHGIGEQRPMDTLRAFVEAILDVDPASQPETYYSKPDELSDGFELRRLSTRASRPRRTDFFEFYWAHRMPTATWSRMLEWLRRLLWRQRRDVPKQAKVLWWSGWATAAMIAIALVASVVFFLAPGLRPSWWPWASVALPAGIAALLLLLQGFVLSYVGDAAVYLSASPRNVAARNEIRGAGVALLERLHASGEYDRIVVVGHSLGSVIGYDVLSHAWQRYNERHCSPEAPRRDALLAAERAAQALRGNTAPGGAATGAWEGAVRRLWREQRDAGFPWLVTDFVTLGSPLAHGDMLLASGRAEFRRKVRQRELPACPPMPEGEGQFSYRSNYRTGSGTPRTTWILHHAALFAATRWTNLYFPASWLLRGDFVGGPVAPLFGHGVRDVPVRTAARRGWLAHTRYWRRHPEDAAAPDAPLVCLREAIDLEGQSLGGTPSSRAPNPAAGGVD